MSRLPPEIMKARLGVVLALRTGDGVEGALAAWMEIEPDAVERMGTCMLEAVALALDEDRAFELVMLASSAFPAELAEVVDGSR